MRLWAWEHTSVGGNASGPAAWLGNKAKRGDHSEARACGGARQGVGDADEGVEELAEEDLVAAVKGGLGDGHRLGCGGVGGVVEGRWEGSG